MKFLLLTIASCFWFLQVTCTKLDLQVNEGVIRGKYMITKQGRTFEAFTSIPYAEPPIGKLRFKPPVPKTAWTGVRDASKHHNVCPQRDIYRRTDLIEGNEDCLYLNVYSPKVSSKEVDLLPVMVFFHGGGFLAGSAEGYQPQVLMDRDIILVTVNYRLGALGFLSTGDDVVPGNNGLKDQNLALKWIKANIENFGGDSNKITIFGESAGGASVHFHLLSPLSKGLVANGISQSGTAFCNWALAPPGESVLHSKKLARIFNCPVDNSKNMVKCLMKIDALKIIEQDRKFMKWDTDPMIPFKPTVEHPHPGAFLTAHPFEIIKSGNATKVPWMTGVNTEDGALRATGIFANNYLLGDLNDEFDRLVPISLLYDKTSNDVDATTRKIKQFYFNNEPLDETSQSKVIDMYTDSWFMSAADEGIRHHLDYVKAPIYYYLFGYRGSTSLTAIFGDRVNNYGVCHADELQYLFPLMDEMFPEVMASDSDVQVMELLTTLWANFAKTGNPTPEVNTLIPAQWDPVETYNMEYYHIGGPQEMQMKEGLFIERAQFWRDLLHTDLQQELKNEV